MCVGSIPFSVAALPIVPAYVKDKACKLLIDIGCSMSIINKRFVQRCNQSNVRVLRTDGSFVDSLGSAECTLLLGVIPFLV